VSNLTPLAHPAYRIGIPSAASGRPPRWVELLCSAERAYGGDTSGPFNPDIVAQRHGAHGFADSVVLHLPALSTMILKETR
jgi:hypothetical protein